MTKDKTINQELIDKLPKDYQKPGDLIGENGLLSNLPNSGWSEPWPLN
jgi:hypothetical protein